MRFFRIIRDSVSAFRRADGFNRAAAISFYAFFSLIPVMLLLTAVLGFLLGSSAGLLDKVVALTKENFPYVSDRVVSDLRGLSRSWKTFGWLSLIMLIWSAEMVFNSVSEALIVIFDVKKSYGFFRKKIFNVLVLCVAAITSLVSIASTAAAKLALKYSVKPLKATGLWAVYSSAVGFVVNDMLPFVLMVASVFVVYRVFSAKNLNMRYALYGSVFFTAMWEAAKQIFAWYVSNYPNYNKFYGSLGTIMMLLAWFFFSAIIFLFSASVATAAYKSRNG
ncbi:YihY/virulence factor BrkB family protein [bacterium]|nr:MAG: YihY/virulence factor BrkB family protein [bacterium]